MRFQAVLKTRCSIKKQKEYEFPEISDVEYAIAMTHTYEKPYMINRNRNYFAMYRQDDGLALVYLHSWDKFISIKESQTKIDKEVSK